MIRRLLILLAVTALAVFGADINGAWNGSVDGPQGSMPLTLTLKAEGAELTGTMNLMDNDMKIGKGKIDGDKISFDVNDGMISVTGTVNGDEIKLHLAADAGEADALVKRVKQ
jgi:hypothetical protein